MKLSLALVSTLLSTVSCATPNPSLTSSLFARPSSSASVSDDAAAASLPASPFSLSKTFGSNMVLQRDSPAVLFGAAPAGSQVSIVLDGDAASQSFLATADSAGIWRQFLPSQPATKDGQGRSLSFSAFGSDENPFATISNVLFGDVYMCGGQSNMQHSSIVLDADEVAKADSYPTIRVFTVGQGTGQVESPLSDLVTVEQGWTVASSAAIANPDSFAYFSAVCWVFGRTIHDSLGGAVPIGLVSNNWGGTSVHLWADDAAFDTCGLDRGDDKTLYNSMVYPYAVGPTSLSGFIWYQGESDADEGPLMEQYNCLFPEMINSWRRDFNKPDAFFGFVIISTWCPGSTTSVPAMRDVQLASVSSLSNIGWATNADHGAGCDIHPGKKAFIGRRLAASAMDIKYGVTDGMYEWRSPIYETANYLGGGAVAVSVSKKSSGRDTSRTLKDVYPYNQGTVDCEGDGKGQCSWGEIFFEDGVWRNATLSVLGKDEILMTVNAEFDQAWGNATKTKFGYSAIPMMVSTNKHRVAA